MTNINEIKVHGSRPYDRGGKVRWLLTELGVDYKPYWINTAAKENETPEYLKLNPMGRVPFLEMGDVKIYESGAICSYLADKFIDKGLAPKPDSPQRAAYLQWMWFATATLDTIQIRVMVIEDIPQGPVRTQKEAQLISDLQDAMEMLNVPVSQNKYLLGNKISAADVCMGYHLYFLRMWPELDVVIQKYPHVISYLDRLKKEPNAIKAEVFTYED